MGRVHGIIILISMADCQTSELSKEQYDSLCCTYAALILHDDNIDISAEKLNKLIVASNNRVEAYMPGLFAKALKNVNINDLFANVGAGSNTGPVATGDNTQLAEPTTNKKEEKKAEVEEEDEVDMMGLFGD